MRDITKVWVQRYVASGTVVTSITAHDEKGRRIGREEKTYDGRQLTDSEVCCKVNADDSAVVFREILGPAVAGRW